MKTNHLIPLAAIWFILAIGSSVTIWGEVSLAAKIGLFAFGLASGVNLGQWLTRRNSGTDG